MTDDATDRGQTTISTPAEVIRDHPTMLVKAMLVKAPPITDPDRRMATHIGDEGSLARMIALTASVVPGVHALGSPTARAVDKARTRVFGRTGVPGVHVLSAEDTLNVAVSLVTEYPANLSVVADSVRADLAAVLEPRYDGLVEIDITVTDVHGPFDPIEPVPGVIDADAADEGTGS